jgi:beta-lactamase superfamily II metal-dependent hydrolase
VTIPASNIKAPALEIHVLGGSKGESVVLKLPDGQWGVVDCYSESVSNADANPTIRFLRSRNVTSLLFVSLTHPHDDHFLGMVRLIEEFRPREFWRFGCLSHEHIKKSLQYYELEALNGGVDESSRSNQELLDLFGLAFRGAKQRTMSVFRAHSRMTMVYPDSAQAVPFRIECLSPTGRQIELYERAILECVGPDGQKARTLYHSQHNDISVVLQIVYGDTRIILGGDLESEGWTEVIREAGPDTLSASAVKVSHHGSENGYCDTLWSCFAATGKPIAVVAPAHRYKLPKRPALMHISENARAIYATCMPRSEWNSPRAGDGAGIAAGTSIESRIAIRETFSTIASLPMSETGRCSFTFDSVGNVDVELDAPAVSLMR